MISWLRRASVAAVAAVVVAAAGRERGGAEHYRGAGTAKRRMNEDTVPPEEWGARETPRGSLESVLRSTALPSRVEHIN